jgi:hypothetical protein
MIALAMVQVPLGSGLKVTDAPLKNVATSTLAIEILHSRFAAFVGLRGGIIGLD